MTSQMNRGYKFSSGKQAKFRVLGRLGHRHSLASVPQLLPLISPVNKFSPILCICAISPMFAFLSRSNQLAKPGLSTLAMRDKEKE